MSKKLIVTQVRSSIGRLENQKLTVKALGLKRIGSSVEHNDNPAVRGMINTVRHLVEVKEV